MVLCFGLYGYFVVKGIGDGFFGVQMYDVYIVIDQDCIVVQCFGCDVFGMDYQRNGQCVGDDGGMIVD